VDGGTSVTITSTDSTTGTIKVGNNATGTGANDPTGAINVTVSSTGAKSNLSMGAVTIQGGSTVSVTQNIGAAVNEVGQAARNTTGGDIAVTGGSSTSSVTVAQTAAATSVAPVNAVTAVTAVSSVTAATETAAFTFANGLAPNASFSIGGLTVTATGGAVGQPDLVNAFKNLADGATTGTAGTNIVFSGKLSGWTSGAVSGNSVTFTSVTANTNVTDISYTDSKALSSVTITQGAAAVTAVTGVAAAAAVAAVGGVIAGKVEIKDVNQGVSGKTNSITTASVDSYGASSSVKSDALSSLTLANSAKDMTVLDSGTLALTVNNLGTGAAVTDATVKTLTITASGKASSLNLTAAAATSITVAGDQKLDLSSSTAAAVTSFTSTNTAGVTVALNAGSTGSFGDGNDTVTVASTATKAITLGAGDDTAIISGALGTGGSVAGGAGSNTLKMSGAIANGLTSTFATAVTGFQKLSLTDVLNGGAQTINFTNVGSYSDVTVESIATLASATTLTLSNGASNDTLTLKAGSANAVYSAVLKDATGTNDVYNLKLSAGAATDFGKATLANIETVNITSTDTATSPSGSNVMSLLVDATGDAQKTLTVSGNAATKLTAASKSVTSVDASNLSVAGSGKAGTGLEWASGALTAAATIKGSANGGDKIDASAATKAVTVTVYGGANVVKGSSTTGSTLNGAAGADTITGGDGADTIIGGGGADVITGGKGADQITLSGNTSTLKFAAANSSGTNTSNTIQTAELTSGFDIIKGAVAGDKLDFASLLASGYSGMGGLPNTSDLVLSGSSLQGQDDKLVFVAGTYDAAAGTFTFAANGKDSALTYDTTIGTGTAYETVILVGYTAAQSTSASAGVITLG